MENCVPYFAFWLEDPLPFKGTWVPNVYRGIVVRSSGSGSLQYLVPQRLSVEPRGDGMNLPDIPQARHEAISGINLDHCERFAERDLSLVSLFALPAEADGTAREGS